MKYVSGELFTKEGWKPGYLGFDKYIIQEIGAGSPPKPPVAHGLIIPSFVNMHTHIGDAFIKNKKIHLPKNIKKLVAPPDGIKHQLLQNTEESEILSGMTQTITFMQNTGTEFFCDFREQGILGIQLLKKAMKDKYIQPILFSRPQTLTYDSNELNILLKHSPGIGISGLNDWNYEDLKKIAHLVHQKNKMFAMHASEISRENIDDILDLHPTFLVHMIHATESDLQRVHQENIPIVVCPRTNAFFGMKPPFEYMKSVGNTLLLGTDNAMITPPNLLEELQYLLKKNKAFTLDELLHMITYVPRKVLNHTLDILVPNSSANFVVLEKKTLRLLYISIYKNR